MTITVVIPTRDRPWQLREALQSVLDQTLDGIEVIVVNDGSQAQYGPAYRGIEDQAPACVRFIHLVRTPRGHGSSYARNIGGGQAIGTYLTFLDDDDVLTDMSYLERTMVALAGDAGPVDLHFADQVAFAAGVKVERNIWIEDLRHRLGEAPPGDAAGAHVVTPSMLLACVGFAHLNTTVVRRAIFDAIGGFDECLRYESDRDFYLRAIDLADVSTALSRMGRAVFQLRLLDKAVLFSTRPEVGAYARRHRGYVLKRITEALYAQKDFSTARYYAWSALPSSFTLKWFGFCLLTTLRSAVAPAGPARAAATPHQAAAYQVAPDAIGKAPTVLS